MAPSLTTRQKVFDCGCGGNDYAEDHGNDASF
jgi:hypothetical protein